MTMWGSKAIEPQGPGLASRTSFLGDFVFPVIGRLARHAALAEVRRSASWDASEIEGAQSLPWRIREAKPEDRRDYLVDSAYRVIRMLEQACTRGAKYQVAAEALLQRVDELETKIAMLRLERIRARRR